MIPKERDLFAVRQKQPKVSKKRKISKDSIPKKAKILKKSKKNEQKRFNFPLVEPLTYQTIKEGQVILCCIRDVRELEIVVSLPHRLVGHVPITNISEVYTKLLRQVANEEEIDESVYSLADLYSPGQILSAQVKKISMVNDKHRVLLSIQPKDANSILRGLTLYKGLLMQCACISSEDNGYIMETGLPLVFGAFLPKSDAPPGIGVGSTFSCRISDIKEADQQFSLTLTANTDTKFDEDSKNSKGAKFFPFPGEKAYAKIIKAIPEGLRLKMGEYNVFVDKLHLLKPYKDHAEYTPGKIVEGKVLYVDVLSRLIHLSINESFSNGENLIPSLKVGDQIDDAVVYKSTKYSIHLKLSEEIYGICPSYLITGGGSLSYANKKFPVGKVKRCRILQYSALDQIYTVSMKKSVLNEKVLGMENLEIGEIITVVIKEHIPAGAVVAISQHLDGFVPKIHLTDSNMANPEKKLPIGKKVRARVLRLVPAQLLHLTLKSILVQSELAILKEALNNLVGTHVEGVVVKISFKGLLIEFYNGLKGNIPRKFITTDDLNKSFKIGQVVKSQVIKVFDDGGILLSMIDFKVYQKMKKDEVVKEENDLPRTFRVTREKKVKKKNIDKTCFDQ